MDDLSAVEAWAGALLVQLQPAARRQATADIARELRRSQQARIAAQRNADGSAYDARKPRLFLKNKKLREKQGRIKRKAMFAKLRTARYLKIENDGNGLAVGFSGRVAMIARVHQEGQTAEVKRGGRSYKYPVRQLLGFTQEDREMIRDKLLAHIVK